MKITFKNFRERALFALLCTFPLGSSIAFLWVAYLASTSHWRVLLLFNEYGEAWLDVLILMVSVIFMVYILLFVGGEKK